MADDNSQLISSLMGMLGDNPQEKISAVLSSLTGNQNAAAQDISSGADSQPDVSDNPPAGADKQSDATPAGALPDLSMLMKMQGLLSQLGGTNDERSNLLAAIRPFLSEERKPHVDRALQMLKLTKLAEAAKDMDLLKDFKL